MNSYTIQSTQNDLIRQILQVQDMNILERIKKLLCRENHAVEEAYPTILAEEEAHYKTRAEIMADMEEAFKTAKLAREGKIEGRPIEELLNEL